MRAGGYGRVPYPWRASVDLSTPHAASFYGSLVQQALRYGSPAKRRFGPLVALAARAGLPPPRLTSAAVRIDRHERPDLDELKAQLRDSWSQFASRSERLPAGPPGIALLELQRAAARTVLVFGGSATPLLVIKFAHDVERIEKEVQGLSAAAPAAIAPSYLGRVGEAHVQEGLPGHAMRIDAVTPARSSALPWHRSHEAVSQGLIKLATTTAHEARPTELEDPSLERAAQHPTLNRETIASAHAALTELADFERAVLKHGDAAAQNCLMDETRLQGLVDWENCKLHGAPGFDIYNFAVAILEHGVALARWSEDRVISAFERAWKSSAFFDEARSRARDAAHAAGASVEEAQALQTAFFLRRFARRLDQPAAFATSARLASRMLEIACAR